MTDLLTTIETILLPDPEHRLRLRVAQARAAEQRTHEHGAPADRLAARMAVVAEEDRLRAYQTRQ